MQDTGTSPSCVVFVIGDTTLVLSAVAEDIHCGRRYSLWYNNDFPFIHSMSM